MKKFRTALLAMILAAAFVFPLAACGGSDPTGGTGSTESGTGGTLPGGEDETPALTSAQVVSAIGTATAKAEQNYDFTFNLAGNVSVGTFVSPNANANYVCNYRYNQTTGDLKFKRVTSGLLLYDATEYIYSSGMSRICVKMNEKNVVKKISVEPNDAELSLINAPFTTLVKSLSASEITSITEVSSGNYKATLKLSAENVALNAICKALGKMDTSISLKGVTVTNPANGIDFSFTMSNGNFTGYTVKASVGVPVKGTTVTFNLTYTQRDSATAVQPPVTAGLVTDAAEIGTEINAINKAITDVKNDDAYSIEVNAENDMDPGWNVLATVDSYKACLYKHGGDFNHSYRYDTHHQSKGKEAYEYTVGNISDGTTHIVDRKGINSNEPIANVSADERFDLLTGYFMLESSSVDCIQKAASSGTTTYTVYLKDSAVAKYSDDIVGLLNTCEADGVVDVKNNFNNNEYTVKDASLVIVINSDGTMEMNLETEIKYNPVAGDYTENNVTLKNTLQLTVNGKLAKAQTYTAPAKASKLDALV